MCRIIKFVVLMFVLLSAWASPCWSVDKTSTGFYYPTSASNILGDKGWLASGCNGNGQYYSDEYHIGHDFMASVDSPIYLIADGEVVVISYSGWGTGNVGALIKHRKTNGEYFLALYGHIITDVTVGKKVLAGQELGKIGYWSGGNHLHFGILPSVNYPANQWGRLPCGGWPSTNGFVDPINWLTTQTPYPNVGHYSNGFHTDGTSQAFVDAFNQNNPKIGWPFDNGGTAYVHEIFGQYSSVFSVIAQDFQGDMNAEHFGTDGKSMLILNPAAAGRASIRRSLLRNKLHFIPRRLAARQLIDLDPPKKDILTFFYFYSNFRMKLTKS